MATLKTTLTAATGAFRADLPELWLGRTGRYRRGAPAMSGRSGDLVSTYGTGAAIPRSIPIFDAPSPRRRHRVGRKGAAYGGVTGRLVSVRGQPISSSRAFSLAPSAKEAIGRSRPDH